MKLIKILLLISILGIFTSCEEDEAAAVAADVLACKATANNHSGCCSSHGGADVSCATSSYLYNQNGKLICNDGSTSPTCTW